MFVQVNAATIDGVTPLYNCCASGSVGCMELLLQSGAHTRARQTHFPSALHEACKRGKHTQQEAPTPLRGQIDGFRGASTTLQTETVLQAAAGISPRSWEFVI